VCVALVGGMDRLRKHYEDEAAEAGVELRVFNTWEPRLGSKVRHVDAIVLFTNKVSHTARRVVIATAKSQDIPVRALHSCGLCTLRECLGCLSKESRPRPCR
jgi:hypothetical protein